MVECSRVKTEYTERVLAMLSTGTAECCRIIWNVSGSRVRWWSTKRSPSRRTKGEPWRGGCILPEKVHNRVL